jgi:hypothetical protein
MINKQDVLDRAAEWHLRAEVVEKDYVLGWLLAAISSHPELQALWIFKGGTCIKKTYFETYHFSEDLDFTLVREAPYSQAAILEQLQAVARSAAEMSGLELPTELIRVLPRHNKAGQDTFQGRLYYRGPSRERKTTLPSSLTSRTMRQSLLNQSHELFSIPTRMDCPVMLRFNVIDSKSYWPKKPAPCTNARDRVTYMTSYISWRIASTQSICQKHNGSLALSANPRVCQFRLLMSC